IARLVLVVVQRLAAERLELREELALEAELTIEELLRVREVLRERLGRGALARVDHGRLELAEALEPGLGAFAVVLDGDGEALAHGREIRARRRERGGRLDERLLDLREAIGEAFGLLGEIGPERVRLLLEERGERPLERLDPRGVGRVGLAELVDQRG